MKTGFSPAAVSSRRAAFTVIEFLVVLAVIGIVAAMLLPATRSARGPARRTQCRNHLKQIALALHNYKDEYGVFPPATTVDCRENPLHSWRTLLLPYLDQKTLYDTIDLSKPWDDPGNQQAFDTSLYVFQCPSANLAPGQTTYMAILGPNTVFQADRPRALADIKDSHAGTILVAEVDAAHAVHWMSPNDASEDVLRQMISGAELSHPGTFAAAFVDGSVQSIGTKEIGEKLHQMLTISGDE